MKRLSRAILAAAVAVGTSVALGSPAAAATNIVSTPVSNTLVPTPDYRAGGAHSYVAGGLTVSVTSATASLNKVQLAFPTPTSFPLANLGELDVTATGDGGYPYGPGLNIFVDLDGDSSDLEGILVFEEVYGQNLWVPASWPALTAIAPDTSGGNGSPYHGTLAEWLTALANNQLTATVLGVALNYGSGVPVSSWTVTSVTFADTTYTFDLAASPVTPTPSPSATDSLPLTGSQLPMNAAIAGAAVILVGAVLVLLGRRRRGTAR